MSELKQVRHGGTENAKGALSASGDKALVGKYRVRAAIDNMEETV